MESIKHREFATCSEDQTCCIWKMEDKNTTLIEKLTVHTKAVTVDLTISLIELLIFV